MRHAVQRRGRHSIDDSPFPPLHKAPCMHACTGRLHYAQHVAHTGRRAGRHAWKGEGAGMPFGWEGERLHACGSTPLAWSTRPSYTSVMTMAAMSSSLRSTCRAQQAQRVMRLSLPCQPRSLHGGGAFCSMVHGAQSCVEVASAGKSISMHALLEALPQLPVCSPRLRLALAVRSRTFEKPLSRTKRAISASVESPRFSMNL